MPNESEETLVAEQAVKLSSSVYINESGKVYTGIVPNAPQENAATDYSRQSQSGFGDSFGGAARVKSDLVNVGSSKHLRINHSDDVFAVGDNHIKSRKKVSGRKLSAVCKDLIVYL